MRTVRNEELGELAGALLAASRELCHSGND